MKMVLSLVSDPKNNSSSLKLSPLKRNTKRPENPGHLDNLRADDDTLTLVDGTAAYLLASRFRQMEIDDATYCFKPIRIKHEVYAQKNGWADQPFNLVDDEDDIKLDMNLQDLINKENSVPAGWKNPSENRLCFPYTNTYLEVEYERPMEGMEAWTCYAVLDGDADKTHLPIAAYVLERLNSK